MPLVFFVFACFFVLNISFSFAKGQDSKPVPSQETTIEAVTPYPQQILECQATVDCSAVKGVCGEWVVVNKKNEKPLGKVFSVQDVQSECIKAKESSKPKLECRKNLCERIQGGGGSEASLNRWKDQCPPNEVEGALDGINQEVKMQIFRLHSVLGWERSEAVTALAKMGTDANKAIPWVLSQLKNRESFSSSKEAQCLIGDLPSEEMLISALDQMDPSEHPAIPLFIEWLSDEKQLYRHADILKHLRRVGIKALPALGVLDNILEKANDKKWTEERGLLALEVVSGLGSEAKSILPHLQNWLEQSTTLKSQLLTAMMKIDPDNSNTKKAALYCLKQNEDTNCRLLSLHFLNRYPEELVDHLDLLAKMLNAAELSQFRMAALRAVQGLGVKGKPLVEDVARLGLQNQEDVRRMAALVLKSIDPEGKQSLSILKKKVYQGFAFEPQYIWKVIDSPLTKLELLKSYYYFVTGKRYKFSELKIAPEMEKQLVYCINSPECPNRTSAMAAVVLLKSEDSRLAGFLVNAMKTNVPAIRWDAAGAYILIYGNDTSSKNSKELAKAWALQDEALQQGGSVRLIDLEDILLATENSVDKKFQFVTQRFKSSDSVDALDVLLLLANQDAVGARKLLSDTVVSGDKQKVLSILSRMSLIRGSLSPWLFDLNKSLLNHADPAIQETAVLNQMSLKINR